MGSSFPIFGVKIKKYLKPPTRKGTWYAQIVLLEIFPSLNRTSGFNEPLSTKATRVFLARRPWFGAENTEATPKVMKPLHVNIGTVPSGYSKKGIAYLHKYLESVFLAFLSVSTPKFSTLLPPGTCRRSNARTALPQPAASSNASNFSMLLGYAFPLCVRCLSQVSGEKT